jgi:enoyl-CoA hydratase
VVDYSSFTGVQLQIENGIAHVTLAYQTDSSPQEVRRAQHWDVANIWRKLDEDPDVKSVLISGVGDKEFYWSGLSPKRTPTDEDPRWESAMHMKESLDVVEEMLRFTKPVVSEVNGAAGGAGLTLVLLSDISIIAEDAWIFDPHNMLAIAAGDGAGGLLPLYTGIARAKLYLLTSQRMTGKEAEQIGIVSLAVPRDALHATAADYARRLADMPSVSTRFIKQTVNQWLKLGGIVSHDYSGALEMVSIFSPERDATPYTEYPPRFAR